MLSYPSNPIYTADTLKVFCDRAVNIGWDHIIAEGHSFIYTNAGYLENDNTPLVALYFNPEKLLNDTGGKVYLKNILTKARSAFINLVGLAQCEKATINNILVCDDYKRESTNHSALTTVIKNATGLEDNNLFILSKAFIESFDLPSEYNTYTKTDNIESSELYSDYEAMDTTESYLEAINTTKHPNDNTPSSSIQFEYFEPQSQDRIKDAPHLTPLTNEELQRLLDYLTKSLAPPQYNHNTVFKDLGMSIDKHKKFRTVGTDSDETHDLMSRLYHTKKEIFYLSHKGVALATNKVSHIIFKLKYLISKDNLVDAPLTNEELESLKEELIKAYSSRPYAEYTGR